MTTEALGHREQERDDAVRLLAMLRVTLNERIAATTYPPIRNAYADVLSLLGPEEPDTYDPEQPF